MQRDAEALDVTRHTAQHYLAQYGFDFFHAQWLHTMLSHFSSYVVFISDVNVRRRYWWY